MLVLEFNETNLYNLKYYMKDVLTFITFTSNTNRGLYYTFSLRMYTYYVTGTYLLHIIQLYIRYLRGRIWELENHHDHIFFLDLET